MAEEPAGEATRLFVTPGFRFLFGFCISEALSDFVYSSVGAPEDLRIELRRVMPGQDRSAPLNCHVVRNAMDIKPCAATSPPPSFPEMGRL
jgi:hypothetical protein